MNQGPQLSALLRSLYGGVTPSVAFTDYGVPVVPAPLWFHAPLVCGGRACTIHDPSDHPLRLAPIYLGSGAVCYRVCEHGIRHPDPDSRAHFATRHQLGYRMPVIRHNKKCDGCCT